jgi:hypothetical protein
MYPKTSRAMSWDTKGLHTRARYVLLNLEEQASTIRDLCMMPRDNFASLIFYQPNATICNPNQGRWT